MKNILFLLALVLWFGTPSVAQMLEVQDTTKILDKINIGNSPSTFGSINIADHNADQQVRLFMYDGGVKKSVLILDDNNNAHYGSQTPHRLTFRTNNQSSMFLTETGELGLGTSIPGALVHASRNGGSGNNQVVGILESVTSGKPVLQFTEGGFAQTGGMAIAFDGSGIQNKLEFLDITGNPVFTFQEDARMGIQTSTPLQKLDVNGNIGFIDGGDIKFFEGVGVNSRIHFDGINLNFDNYDNAGDIITSTNTNVQITPGDDVILDTGDNFFWLKNGLTKLTMSPGGAFIVGTTNSPAAMMHIKQPSATNGFLMDNVTTGMNFSWHSTSTDFSLRRQGTLVGSFAQSNGAYTALSDRRLKKNIEPLPYQVLDKILDLNAVSYHYIDQDDESEKSIGFIAQEMQALFPALVEISKDGKDDFLAINYHQINVIAIKAIQEQTIIIEDLNRQLDALDGISTKAQETEELISSLTAALDDIERNSH